MLSGIVSLTAIHLIKRTKNTGGLDYQENVQEMNQTVNITPPPFVEPHRLNTRIEEEDIDKEKDGGPTG
jgi:hypothetical protein